jgi:hypothetical protein
MIQTRTPLRQQVLKLPAKKRMSLAVLLLESLEGQADDSALLKVLKKRSAELHSGMVKGLTTEQAYGFSL